MMKQTNLQVTIGYRTALIEGDLVPNSPQHMTTELFYPIYNQGKVSLLNQEYIYLIAKYSLECKEEYASTYCYEKEQNWTTYTKNVTLDSYTQEDSIIQGDCYIRICLKRVDGMEIPRDKEGGINDIIRLDTEECPKADGEEATVESKKVIQEIQKQKEDASSEGTYTCAILTDSHYTINGTWDDTMIHLEEVHKEVELQSIIHLGDLTDGLVSKRATTHYVNEIMKDLEGLQIPRYICIGNHDTNYFRNNLEVFTKEEQKELYLGHLTKELATGHKLSYYKDLASYQLRFVFLSSFDEQQEVLRYGYDDSQLEWLEEVLKRTPCNYKVILFSHVPPMKQLDFWSIKIRGEERIVKMLEAYNKEEAHHIMAFIHGHTHADYVYNELSFPIVSIGCNKYEYFMEHKPQGATTHLRKRGSATQDLWEVMMVNPKGNKIEFIRYGAGESRSIDCTKKMGNYLPLSQIKGNTQIWAHRGASGYAPENTLEAFRLAIDLEADGIELDVQYTKDKQLVVIHDERIDRTSNGSGFVVDYTLEELRRYNYNRTKPAYKQVAIPTLEEVLQLIKPTKLVLNIELKTSINFYEGIEEDVVQLVQRYEMQDRVIYSSFNHESVLRVKALDRQVVTAFLYADGIAEVAKYASSYGVDAINPSLNNMKYPNLMESARAYNLKVYAWTANTEKEYIRLSEMGVDAIITNYPNNCREVVYGR